MANVHHIDINLVHPAYLESNRSEVSIEQLRDSHTEFLSVCSKHHLDPQKSADRRRIINIDETGISGTKSGKKTHSEYVMMPSSCKVFSYDNSYNIKDNITFDKGSTSEKNNSR